MGVWERSPANIEVASQTLDWWTTSGRPCRIFTDWTISDARIEFAGMSWTSTSATEYESLRPNRMARAGPRPSSAPDYGKPQGPNFTGARPCAPWKHVQDETVRLVDRFSDSTFELRRDDIQANGIYVELGPWGSHFFRFDRRRRPLASMAA
jgi:hypothetical protein